MTILFWVGVYLLIGASIFLSRWFLEGMKKELPELGDREWIKPVMLVICILIWPLVMLSSIKITVQIKKDKDKNLKNENKSSS